MLSLPQESGDSLSDSVDYLDTQEAGVEEEVPRLIKDQIVVLGKASSGNILLNRDLLAKLHGGQNLLHLLKLRVMSKTFINHKDDLPCQKVVITKRFSVVIKSENPETNTRVEQVIVSPLSTSCQTFSRQEVGR